RGHLPRGDAPLPRERVRHLPDAAVHRRDPRRAARVGAHRRGVGVDDPVAHRHATARAGGRQPARLRVRVPLELVPVAPHGAAERAQAHRRPGAEPAGVLHQRDPLPERGDGRRRRGGPPQRADLPAAAALLHHRRRDDGGEGVTSRGAAHDPVPARRRFAGVDVGGTNVRVAVWEEGAERPTLVAASPLPPDLGALVELVAGALGGPVAGVGVGVPGRVVDGVAVWVPNARFLEGPGLAAELGARLAAPVALANDGHVALLSEARFGAARGLKDALLVTIGTGIGGAVMRSGRLVRGANGTAGSFGWLALGAPPVGGHDRPGAAGDPAGAATARGSAPPEVGPWEATASGQALERRAAALSRPVRARELSAAAAAGDVEAAAVLDRFVAE